MESKASDATSVAANFESWEVVKGPPRVSAKGCRFWSGGTRRKAAVGEEFSQWEGGVSRAGLR